MEANNKRGRQNVHGFALLISLHSPPPLFLSPSPPPFLPSLPPAIFPFLRWNYAKVLYEHVNTWPGMIQVLHLLNLSK